MPKLPSLAPTGAVGDLQSFRRRFADPARLRASALNLRSWRGSDQLPHRRGPEHSIDPADITFLSVLADQEFEELGCIGLVRRVLGQPNTGDIDMGAATVLVQEDHADLFDDLLLFQRITLEARIVIMIGQGDIGFTRRNPSTEGRYRRPGGRGRNWRRGPWPNPAPYQRRHWR